ncbi:MAG: cytochrome B [Caulobacter sp.]|nr:cytochrome B [Caulobacter sp.]
MQTVQPRRWDPLVQLTHWGVAAGVLINGVFTREGSGAHLWVGYGVAALLALRWVWGLVGSPEARFTAFPPSLGKAAAHVREIARGEKTAHRSHNPLGALMVYALWATLAVVIGSGIAMTGLPGISTPAPEAASTGQRSGPAAEANEEAKEADDDDADKDGAEDGAGGEGDELMEEVHEAAANLLFVLAALHLLGVAFETRRSGRGILMAMLPGGRNRRPRE